MKFTKDDFVAAVDAGIIDARQADALEQFHKERLQAPRARNEHFRLANNFGEIFICIGQIMVLTVLADSSLVWVIAGACLFWAMGEYFSFHKPRLAPAIVASVGFAYLAANAASAFIFPENAFTVFDFKVELIGIAALASLAAFLRFRIPFLLLPIAAALTLLSIMVARDVFPGLPYLTIFAVCGLLILGLAIWLDAQDPLRQSRVNSYAFWLFIIGSPLTIHPLFFSILKSQDLSNIALVIFLCAVAASTLGLILDRRSLVASSLIYFTVSIGYMNSQASGSISGAVVPTTLIVGTGVILLGVFWYPLRTQLMRLLPEHPLLEKLPPNT
ncbi:MAG: hypothetical protein ACR2OR_03040 [Hyphomicrobiales bacterium]